MTAIIYRVELTPDDNGTLLVTCPDLPMVTTFGETETRALVRARHAIEEALAAMRADGDVIPEPTYQGGWAVSVDDPR